MPQDKVIHVPVRSLSELERTRAKAYLEELVAVAETAITHGHTPAWQELRRDLVKRIKG